MAWIKCKKCDKENLIIDMHYQNGTYNTCKNCWNERHRIRTANLSNEERKLRSKKQTIYRNKKVLENPDYRRHLNLKAKYNLTLEDYEQMVKNQNGVCAICHNPPKNEKLLDVDHNHKTEEVRELLCFKCNAALGLVDDNSNTLIAMINYLIKHSNLEQEFSFRHD